MKIHADSTAAFYTSLNCPNIRWNGGRRQSNRIIQADENYCRQFTERR
jgi:hypothetical protein